jgi:hypothetical protein
MFMYGNMTDKLRDKKRNYKIDEESYGHPQHEPYKREHRDWHNFLLDDEDEWQYVSQDSDEDWDTEDDEDSV